MRSKQPGRLEVGDVPTLTPELDRPPAACSRCGSGQLQQRPQMAGEMFGSLSCSTCGAVLAYLRAPLRPRTVG